eukprot:c20715_g2_i1.p1 GENE.c20715_g2_i1~~c20715_g2_i1.p1  ORF type:complete len:614 (-),score=85.79 c20715_g2_i1:43-1884(-)
MAAPPGVVCVILSNGLASKTWDVTLCGTVELLRALCLAEFEEHLGGIKASSLQFRRRDPATLAAAGMPLDPFAIIEGGAVLILAVPGKRSRSRSNDGASPKRLRPLEPVDLEAATAAAQAFLADLLSVVPQECAVNDEDASSDDEDATFCERVSAGAIAVLPLTHGLEKGTSGFTVTTTPQAQALWRVILLQLAAPMVGKSHRCLIIGSPGIGKSWSVLWALRELLLAAAHPVVVLERGVTGLIYVFRFVDGAYSVTVERWYDRVFGVLSDESVYYIYDASADAKHSHQIDVMAKTVLVCSPDPEHFKQFTAEASAPFYMLPWTAEQLLAVRLIHGPTLSAVVLDSRIQTVGRIPRKVFCDDDTFDYFIARVRGAAVNHQVLIKNVIRLGPTLLDSDPANKAPLSALFVLSVTDSFRHVTCLFVSPYAAQSLSVASAGMTLERVVTAEGGQRRDLGEAFEELVYALLASGWDNVPRQEPTRLRPPWGGAIARIAASPDGVLNVVGANCPRIDAACGPKRVYQITIAKRKPIIKLKVPKNSPVGTLPTLVAGRSAADPLQFVFVVPPNGSFVPPPVHVNGQLSDLVQVSVLAVPALTDDAWKTVFSTRADFIDL